MSRTTSAPFKTGVFAQETDEAPIVLITIAHWEIESLRVCSDAKDVTSRGDVFTAYPFDIRLPDDTDEKAPVGTLTIDNVSRQIINGLRMLQTPPTITMEVVLASSPDVVEASFEDFELVNVDYDALTIQGTISVENFMSEPYPGTVMGPSNFRGLF
jgi:hypothetical protein